jgi:hypothetical protein
MTKYNRGGRALPALLGALVALTLTISGCNSVLESNQAAFADEARVSVEGSSAVPLQLITSTNFIAVRDPVSGELVASEVVAETTSITGLPFNRVFTIRGSDRFLVRLVNPDINVTATVHLRIHLDGREVYSQRATMRDASLQYLTYFDPS